jgi:hypothetical protein
VKILPKSKPNNDALNLGIGKTRKNLKLYTNKAGGIIYEKGYEAVQASKGNELKRKPHGQDYELQRKDLFGKPIEGPKDVEIKSTSTAPLSKLQEKRKAQKGKSYEVVRPYTENDKNYKI